MGFPRFTPDFTIQEDTRPPATPATPATNSGKVAEVAAVAGSRSQNRNSEKGAGTANRAEHSPAAAPVEMGYCPGFHCKRCQNDPTRCGWCADHVGDPGVISCGDCERGRMQRSPVSWRSDTEENETDRLARADGWEPPAEIPPAVRDEIKRIEAQALALGWSHARLWNFRFWPDSREPRGLASVIDEDDRIAAVYADHLIIEKPDHRGGVVQQRFWRFQ